MPAFADLLTAAHLALLGMPATHSPALFDDVLVDTGYSAAGIYQVATTE